MHQTLTKQTTTGHFRPIPKPPKGSGKAARQKRRQDLKRWRSFVNWWVLDADNYTCQICGGRASHAHHVFGHGRSPDDDCEQPNARLSVCHYPCHVAIHRAPPNLKPITQEHVEACLAEAVKHRPEFAG